MAQHACTFCLFLIFYPLSCLAQADTMIVYEMSTQSLDTILPVAFDSQIPTEKTLSSPGSMGNQVPVSMVPPTLNLFPGSNFCDISRAEDHFNPASYPARTAVALRYYTADSVHTGCSGILVSRNFVLTAGHCIYLPSIGFTVFDSLKAVPAFNNGVESIPGSFVKKAYLFKSYFDGTAWNDIALLELKEPIGNQTGWVGLGFDADFNNYQNKVFHKFSYPCYPDPADSAKVYNGDTLYYNYGFINDYSTFIGVTGGNGIQGQSGSSLVYSDNTSFHTIGVMNFGTNYLHYKITNASYFQLKNLLLSSTVGINETEELRTQVKLYPNPFQNTLFFEYDKPASVELDVYSVLGQRVAHETFFTQGRIEIHTDSFPKGMYFVNVRIENQFFCAGKFLRD